MSCQLQPVDYHFCCHSLLHFDCGDLPITVNPRCGSFWNYEMMYVLTAIAVAEPARACHRALLHHAISRESGPRTRQIPAAIHRPSHWPVGGIAPHCRIVYK